MESEEVNKTDASNNDENTIPITTSTTTTTTTTTTNDDLTNGHREEEQAQQSQAQNQYEEFNRDFIENSNEESKEEHESSQAEQQQAEQIVTESNHNPEVDSIVTNEMKTSASNEFTYTSLAGVSRPDDEVDLVDSTNQSQEPVQTAPLVAQDDQLAINLNEQLNLDNKKQMVRESSVNSVDLQSVSIQDDSLKRFTIDEVIDKVKLNSVSNKEVCNYILNLLVDGEFDLEKNFVIKNINSILHMIQVIKCAQPSLKVRSLFVYFLLSLSYFNKYGKIGRDLELVHGHFAQKPIELASLCGNRSY